MMVTIYFLIIVIIEICIPLLLHKRLKRGIKNVIILTVIEVCISLTVFLFLLAIPFYIIFSVAEYPTVTKGINNEYYFEQTEFGMAWTDDGTDLDFYKKRHYWFDKKIGHIRLLWAIEINAHIEKGTKPNFKRLILTENNKLVLDTLLNFNRKFNFKYYPWRN